jgi:hypothetical protein
MHSKYSLAIRINPKMPVGIPLISNTDIYFKVPSSETTADKRIKIKN